MDGSSQALNMDALLAQASWLRRLASHLVADPDVAEDLVQDTWQRALEHPPAEGVNLRSWLAKILRHLAIDRDRDADLRRWHERSARRDEEWSPAEIEERIGLQRTLAEAVLELEEPYRSAITLTYFEGMTAPEIARRQRTSDAAIRQRIARGREMLRARLDRAYHGNRKEWCLLVATFLRKGGPAPAAAFPVGKIAAAAAVIALAGLLAWRQLAPKNDRGPATAPALASAETPRRTTESGTALVPAPSTREAINAGEGPVDPERALRGVVVDPFGAPIPDARIEVFADETSGYSWDADAPRERRRAASTRTDATGVFAVELSRGKPFELEASADGYATSMLGYRYAGEHVTVPLAPGASWEGRVLRASDGEPVPGARLEISTLDGTLDGMRLALREKTSEVDGSFRFDGLLDRVVSLKITPRDRGVPVSLKVDLAPGRSEASEVRIEEGRTIRGRILDAESGQPIPHAEVGEILWNQRFVRADSNGEYAYVGARDRGIVLVARAPGYECATQVFNTAGNDIDLPDHVDFPLTRGLIVRGRVVDADGLPVAGAYVAAVSNRPIDPSIAEAVRIRGRTDARGRFELPDASRELAFTLLARSEGSGALVRPCPAGSPGTDVSIDVGDLRLPVASSLHGTVVDADQLPVPDAVVHLFEAEVATGPIPEGRVPMNPHLARKLTERWARADDQGRFTFVDLAGGEYQLDVRHPSSDAPTSKEVTLASGAAVQGLVLELAIQPSITGRVIAADGRGLAGVAIRAIAADGAGRIEAFARTDDSGSFALTGLETDNYRISIHSGESGAAGDLFLGQARANVSAGTKELVIVLEAASRLSGSVIDAAGRGIGRSVVIGRVPGRDEEFSTIASGGGSFSLVVPVGVSVDLEARTARSKDDSRVAYRKGAIPTDSPITLTIP